MKLRTRNATRGLRAAVALSALLALAACSSDDDDDDGGGGADDDALVVTLSPEQEVPAVATPAPDASGTGTISVDEASGAVTAEVTVTGLTGQAQAAHIHQGAAGESGPVLIGLVGNADGTVWTTPADAVLDSDGLAAFAAGELYFNVHTTANPDGEVRGQIVPDDGTPGDEAIAVTLTTEAEVPALATPAPDASGTGSVSLGDDGAVSGEITVSGLTGEAQAAHIHRGFPGQAGPVLIMLEGNEDGSVWTVPEGEDGTLDEEGQAAFARGELYFNVHTAANPSGELRGQIVPSGDAAPTAFTVRIENVSTAETLATSGANGTDTAQAVPLSPGAYAVHRGDASPLFVSGETASEALEMVAEDGDPSGYADQPGAVVFDTPAGADAPGPIGPGDAYELEFTAVPGDKLSFVTMFIPSNDYFYTPTDEDDSIALFDDDGTPVSGDVTDQVDLWDAGTEQDEEPGTGLNQAQRQAGPDTGDEEGDTVHGLAARGEALPNTSGGDAVADVIRVTLTPAGQ